MSGGAGARWLSALPRPAWASHDGEGWLGSTNSASSRCTLNFDSRFSEGVTSMVITEYRSHAEELADTAVTSGELRDERPRDAEGHCWDGRVCDHADHGVYGAIHFIR